MNGCLGCQRIETEPQSLHDGAIVCSVCPEWRLETEARELLSRPLTARREYLVKLDGNRKTLERAELLRARMTAIHKARAAS
jgi:hypothetical protein